MLEDEAALRQAIVGLDIESEQVLRLVRMVPRRSSTRSAPHALETALERRCPTAAKLQTSTSRQAT